MGKSYGDRGIFAQMVTYKSNQFQLFELHKWILSLVLGLPVETGGHGLGWWGSVAVTLLTNQCDWQS